MSDKDNPVVKNDIPKLMYV